MTWSISASGPKEDVASKIRTTTFEFVSDADEKLDAEEIADALACIAERGGDLTHASVSASGGVSGISISVSRWTPTTIV